MKKAFFADQILLYDSGYLNTLNLFSEITKCINIPLYNDECTNIPFNLGKNSDCNDSLPHALKYNSENSGMLRILALQQWGLQRIAHILFYYSLYNVSLITTGDLKKKIQVSAESTTTLSVPSWITTTETHMMS